MLNDSFSPLSVLNDSFSTFNHLNDSFSPFNHMNESLRWRPKYLNGPFGAPNSPKDPFRTSRST